MGMFKSLALATALTATSALGAMAATLTVSAPVYDTTNPTATPAGGVWASDPYTSPGGSVSGINRSPFNDSTTDYLFVAGNASKPLTPNSPAVLVVSGLSKALTLLWGSTDYYNVLTFYRNGVAIAGATFTGADVSGIPNIVANDGLHNYSVTISGLVFDAVTFASNDRNSFEFANLQLAPVPVPAAGLMLVSAVGGLAALRRRKA